MRGGRISTGKNDGSARKYAPKRTVFLMVEGESEKVYFDRLARMTDDLSIIAKVSREKDCIGIVKRCSKLAEIHGVNDDDLKVAVFDLDVVDEKDLAEAAELAEKEGVTIMASNLSFEVWLLMHLTEISHLGTQSDYEDRLSKELGRTYKKSNGIGDRLNDESIKVAVKRGKKILKDADPLKCKRIINSTTLWVLAELILTDKKN